MEAGIKELDKSVEEGTKTCKAENAEYSEEDLARNGRHALVAYIMKPKAGYGYLTTAAHGAAELPTGADVNVCTTDDFTNCVDALVYFIDPEAEEMNIVYPSLLFDRNVTAGRATSCSFLPLAVGNN